MDDSRILRDRQAAARAAIDRAAAVPGVAAARRLVQVYDGGAMPTAADRVYLTHPVELDGAETEGGAASPYVDTLTTIPVVVLWHAPAVGDQLVATAVGGRWVAEKTGVPAPACRWWCGPYVQLRRRPDRGGRAPRQPPRSAYRRPARSRASP